MKIIIVGGGKVGTTLCQLLAHDGYDVVAIEKDSKNLNSIVEKFDINGVVGNGVVGDIQKEAGVENCDLFIACTPSDEINILSCTVAKKHGAKQTIARVRDPEYFNNFNSEDLGLNMLVNPEHEASLEIARILNYPYATVVEDFVGGNIRLLEYKIPQGSKLHGLALKDIPSLFDARLLICGVVREEETIIPQGNFVLQQGDRIVVTAEYKELHKFFREINASKRKSKRVFILGGGRISFYLAKNLPNNGVDVTVIEKDTNECKRFYEQIPNITVINADGFQQHILLENGVANADAVVALGDDDEKNVLISMFVNTLDGKKAIVKTDKSEYVTMLEKAGINSIVLPKMLTANQIERFVRNLENPHGGKVSGLYRMIGSQAEFLEFIADQQFSALDIALKNLKLKQNTIIVSIVKGNTVVVPRGNDTIQKGDIVLVATIQQGFSQLNDILA